MKDEEENVEEERKVGGRKSDFFTDPNDYPVLPDEIREVLGIKVEEEQLPPLTIESLKLICESPIRIKILKHMFRTKDAHFASELAAELDLVPYTVWYELLELHKYGLLSRFKQGRKVLYRVTNEEGTEIVLKRYPELKKAKLAEVIDFRGKNVRDLKKDKEFNALLNKYALTFEEAIKAISKYYKIETIKNRGEIVAFKRRQQ